MSPFPVFFWPPHNNSNRPLTIQKMYFLIKRRSFLFLFITKLVRLLRSGIVHPPAPFIRKLPNFQSFLVLLGWGRILPGCGDGGRRGGGHLVRSALDLGHVQGRGGVGGSYRRNRNQNKKAQFINIYGISRVGCCAVLYPLLSWRLNDVHVYSICAFKHSLSHELVINSNSLLPHTSIYS